MRSNKTGVTIINRGPNNELRELTYESCCPPSFADRLNNVNDGGMFNDEAAENKMMSGCLSELMRI
jgi:hypothetical protein